MKAKIAFMGLSLCLVVLFGTGDIKAQQGVISIDQVSNLVGPGQVQAGENIRFLLRFNNNTGRKVDISNGFRLSSPDGATWDSTTIDTAGVIINGESKFVLFFDIAFHLSEASCDGVGSDTVGVLGAGYPSRSTRQLPNGFNDTVLAITAWSHGFASTNKSICIDTSFVQPGGTWKWVRVEGSTEYVFFPVFQGLPGQPYTAGAGYCFELVDRPVQPCRVIHVPGDHATIQAAIDAALPCDTIVVAPGVYVESVNLKGKAIVLRSEAGRDSTVIQYSGSGGRVLTCATGEDTLTVIDGFAIFGNNQSRGVVIESASPIIQNCDIHDCVSPLDGGGMYVYNSSAIIRHNKIRNNTSGLTGGGICARGVPARQLEICYNEISGTGTPGEAIGCLNAEKTYIHHNLIRNNTANHWAASGVYLNGTGTTVRIINNTIVGNMHGIVSATGAQPVIWNNIIANNLQGSIQSDMTNKDYNDVFNNSDIISGGPHGISMDPLFVNPASNDYHLLPGSPCINTGDPDPQYADPDGSRNDMGAFPTTGAPGDGMITIAAVSHKLEGYAVEAGKPVRFLLRYINNTGQIIGGVQHGFIVSSPDGAAWDSTSVDTVISSGTGKSPFAAFFDLAVVLQARNKDGISPDTVIAAGIANHNGLPVGYNDTAIAITAWFHDKNSAGKHICLDSGFVPPALTWLWADRTGSERHYPSLNGLPGQPYTPDAGYCFEIVEVFGHLCQALRVPSQYLTIQAAIDAAQSCDTVLVAPGIYVENINMKGKAIVLKSEAGRDSTVIRYGGSGGRVLTCATGEDTTTVIDGFAIDGNNQSRGVVLQSASPIIQNCDIRNCASSLDGAGMYVYNSSAVIRHNRIRNNTSGLTGGGICAQGTPSRQLEICYNEISGTGTPGEAIGCLTAEGTYIHHNLIRNNTASHWAASGVYLNGPSTGIRIINNTIVGNTHGIVSPNNAQPIIWNNIIAYSLQGGIQADMTNKDYNDVFSNSDVISGGPHGISADPMFVNAAGGNFQLLVSSPCIDAGDPAPQYNDPDGSRNDMGAFPYTGEGPQQCRVLRVPGQHATIQAAINAATECDTIMVAPGIYEEFLNFSGKTVRLVSDSGAAATTITVPVTQAALTADAAVIRLPGGSGSATLIKGFTIRGNGVAQGISCLESNPTITDCYITDCAGSWDGGGMWLQKCRPVIRNNIFYRNTTHTTGGALFLHLKDSSGTAIIEGNTFIENSALNGPGIGIIYGQGAIVRRNVFVNNQTPANSTRGGALYGGVVNDVHFINNTLTGNSFGITVVISTNVDVRNNIIAGSTYNGFEIREQNAGAVVTGDYNDVWGSGNSNYYGTAAGSHDLSVNPLLAVDHSLLEGSPCIDAGDPNPIYNDPDGSRNDMGAMPFTGTVPPEFINLIQWKKAFGGNDHWYGVIPRSLYWVEADVASKRPLPGAPGHGYLATITSAEENAFILGSVVAGTHQTSILDEFWLGGRDVGGQWTWITGEPFIYTNWGTGEPNNVGIETALGMWGPHAVEPGKFNNSLPDSSVNHLHRFWSVVEWNPEVADTVIPTNEWILTYCGSTKLDRGFVSPGSIITAYDPSGVLCGAAVVREDGSYGLMPIYRDDPYTPVDEGCVPGDLIGFRINGVSVYAQTPVYWTKNGDRFEVCQFLTQKCQDIVLHSGWNLISWNVALTTDIETLIAPFRDKVDLVLGFDQGALAYDPDLVPFSTLHEVDYHHGYWFKMNSAATLHVCGGYINQFNNLIPIYQGWNLVGYWPDATWTVQSALMTVMSSLQVAIGFDMGAKLFIPGQEMYNTLTHLSPGFGYWIRSSAPDALEYFFLPTAGASTHPTPVASGGYDMASRDWMSLYGKDLTLDSRPIEGNALIEVFTADGVKVGQSSYSGGILKFMPVYGYDANDPNAARYPKDGDMVNVYVNGVRTAPEVEWHGSGTTLQLGSLTTAAQVPGQFALAQNFPNPFNPHTTISFNLPKAGHVTLAVYNMLGQRIRTLADREYVAGHFTVDWDSRSDNGDAVASGVYLYRIEAGSYIATKKMLLLK